MQIKLYKSKRATQEHIVSAYKLRDFLSVGEPIEETGKAYSYVCQRQYQEYTHGGVGFVWVDNTDYEPFIMSEDVFEKAYEPTDG